MSDKKHCCFHSLGEGHISIEEETVRVTRYSFKNGKIVSDVEEPRDFNGPGKITVRCEECGFKHTYNLHSPDLPKWITTLAIQYLDLAKSKRESRA